MIYIIYPCPEAFFPLDSSPPPADSFCPWKLLNDLHYLLISHIIFPPGFILPTYNFAPVLFCPLLFPPGNSLMIFTIYPCPISFSPLDSFCPPYHFAPGNRLIIYTIYPCPLSFFPLDSFSPISFCPLERNCLMIYTIYPCPLSFCPLDWTLGVGLLCFNRMLGQMHLNFVFILIKSPLRQKLMTDAHPVTEAPLVVNKHWPQSCPSPFKVYKSLLVRLIKCQHKWLSMKFCFNGFKNAFCYFSSI